MELAKKQEVLIRSFMCGLLGFGLFHAFSYAFASAYLCALFLVLLDGNEE